MSRLQDFLALPNVSEMQEEIYINARLGTFVVKPIQDEKMKEYRNRSRKQGRRGTEIDDIKFNLLVVSGQTIDPDFSDAELLSKSGFATAEDFIRAKFLPGEIFSIAKKISKLSGYDEDSFEEEIQEAKN